MKQIYDSCIQTGKYKNHIKYKEQTKTFNSYILQVKEEITPGGSLAITRCHEGGFERNLVDFFPGGSRTCSWKS